MLGGRPRDDQQKGVSPVEMLDFGLNGKGVVLEQHAALKGLEFGAV